MIKFTSARLQLLAAVTGASLTCAAAPAIAAPSESGDVKVAAAASSAAAATVQRPATKYCVIDRSTTGTRISRKVCRTAEEWRQLGEDIGPR